MLGFVEDALLEQERAGAGLFGAMEAAVDEIFDQGFKNVIFLGIGGSYSAAMIADWLVRTHSTLPFSIANAGELVFEGDVRLGAETVVFTYSVSGDTPELLAAVEKCKAAGARVYAVIERKGTPLEPLVDRVIAYANGGYYKTIYFIIRMMFRWGDFPLYERLRDCISQLPEIIMQASRQIDVKALDFARRYGDAQLCYLVGSGLSWGCTYCLAMCYLEEMQWMRTKSIRAAEFFHGTLEVIEKGVCVMLLKGEDASRPEMDRVERFCRRVTDDVVVFDAADYLPDNIDPELRPYLSPFVFHALQERLLHNLEAANKHPAELRRYYRQIKY